MHTALRNLQSLMPTDVSNSAAWEHLGKFMESMGGTPVRRHPTAMTGAEAAMVVHRLHNIEVLPRETHNVYYTVMFLCVCVCMERSSPRH